MSGIFTKAALQGRSLQQLQALHHGAHQELVQTEYGSQDRREALAKIETISLAIAQQRIRGPGF